VRRIADFLRAEWFLGVTLATCLLFHLQGEVLSSPSAGPAQLALVLLWLFVVILGSAIAVVRHAEVLAHRLGEPYGTLILTLSVTSIEVMSLTALTAQPDSDPRLVRDTLFSVVMIVLNGMVGVSLLSGAWRHSEQQYNLQGANTYLGLIIPLAVLSLIMPDFTRTTSSPTFTTGQETFLIVMSLALYALFLVVQTSRHRGYFSLDYEPPEPIETHGGASPSFVRHALLLLGYMLPVAFLAEQLAHPVDHAIDVLRAPVALNGMMIAVLVATPEGLGAVRAAMANRLQRAVNIFLGSVLSTIALTVPAMLVISQLMGRHFVLGLQNTDFAMLLLTLAVSMVTFASGRTNVLQGAVHLLLFAAYILLIFQN
jgi:Ca2+:H+ antiporter